MFGWRCRNEEGLDLQVFGYGSSQILELRISSRSPVLSSCSHISKFDPKPIATLSKSSSKPRYLEPSEPPKPSYKCLAHA
jgi:hypothetical protein